MMMTTISIYVIIPIMKLFGALNVLSLSMHEEQLHRWDKNMTLKFDNKCHLFKILELSQHTLVVFRVTH